VPVDPYGGRVRIERFWWVVGPTVDASGKNPLEPPLELDIIY
jgi:hypothetical protein